MQKLPVTRDGKRGSEVLIIDSNEVVRIDKIKEREYVVHTHDSQYVLDTTFENIEEWLFEDGFRMIDSTNIVNMNHVQEYDPKKGVVYFGDPANKKTKAASAARIQKEHIEKILELLKDTSDTEADDLLLHGQSGFKGLNEMIQAVSTEGDEDIRFLRSYATIRAVAERKRAEDKIKHMAYHDSLTDLPNRTLFHEHLKQTLENLNKSNKTLAVLFLDLDRTKVINDTLGHHVGDELLKYLSKKLRDYVGKEGIIARFGGDEFLILLPNIEHVDDAIDFAKGIPTLLSQPFVYENQELLVTASVGISMYPQDGDDAVTLIKNADTAMYRAKEAGGNTFQRYQADMNYRSLERLNLELHLRRALDRNEIDVYYHPLLDLRSGNVFGVEALVRWHHPEYGTISPGEFIPIAEETGLIVPIGNWVLKQACMQNQLWKQMGFPRLTVSVNISVKQFQQPGFVHVVQEALRETGLPPNQLCLEITESVAMKNVSYITETMNKLKMLGIQISIDDFGTGYSSLSYLKRFRVHTLKIDQSFIKDVTTDDDNAAIVTALIAMSHQLKIKTLAEGVETQEQLNFLKEHGCDEIQGYIFSKPLRAPEFEQVIREERSLYTLFS